MEINREAIVEILSNRELDILPPEPRALLIGLFSDGLQGLMDAAVLNNIDKIPQSIRDIVSPYLLEIDWNNVPQQASELFNSFFREGGAGLNSVVSNLVGSINPENILDAIGGLNINLGGVNLSVDGVRSAIDQIRSGGLGGITQVLSDFGGMDLLSLVPGSGIIRTASTIMGVLFNGGDLFTNLFGNNGFGIGTILDSLGLSSTLVGLVAPILGLLGVGGGCPCSPGCRKTDQFITEKEIELLDEEKCETIISNASTSYFPTGDPPDPTKTNDNPVADAYGFIETLLGDILIPKNVLNLTAAILELPRLEKLGRRVESFQNADWPDFANELSYTMRAVEHGLKVADNNITGAEKILRVIIDGQIFDDLFEKKRDDLVLDTLAENSLAIKELFAMVQQLDGTKMGPPALRSNPAKSVKKIVKAHAGIVKSRQETWLAHAKKIKEFIEFALEIWNSLEPGAKPEELSNLLPGSSLNTTVAYPFPTEELEKEIERFQEDHYKMLADLVHTDDSDTIADIMDNIKLDQSASSPLPSRQYQNTLNRLIQDRILDQAPGGRPSLGSTPPRDTFTPSSPGDRSSPVTSETGRKPPITLGDIERLAEETGTTDYNQIVKDLLKQQELAQNSEENC